MRTHPAHAAPRIGARHGRASARPCRSRHARLLRRALLLACATLLATTGLTACDDGGGTGDNGVIETPETYQFESAFEDGASSVSYSGQIARQVLISDLNDYISDLSDMIDAGDFAPTSDGEVVGALDFFYRFDSDANGDTAIRLETDPPTLQSTYNDISSGKDLVGKTAGNDDVTDHKDWSMAFSGWSDDTISQYGGSIDSPEGLIVAYFETIEENALGRVNGDLRMGPDGQTLPVYVTESGLDLKQLTQKFLLGAVNLSQGTDDYLDDDVDGKGLLSDNTGPDDGDPYSALEHQWDEGIGYFGAARAYLQMSDDLIADTGYQDVDGDGAIDLQSEYNFSASVNAAKRDRGSSTGTNYTRDAMEAFLAGRALINARAGQALTEEEMISLQGYRNDAVFAWEAAIGATIVHYINDTLEDMDAFGTDDYDFLDHAKHWSEMKGFALGLQFNPRSPVSDMQFAELHGLIGDAPVLPDADSGAIDSYRDDLLAARALLQDAYGFAQADVEAW